MPPRTPFGISLLRRILYATVALAPIIALAAGAPQPAAAPAAASVTANFTDDFNGSAGSAVDSSKWQTETGDNVNNHERQYYTSGNKNAAPNQQWVINSAGDIVNPAANKCLDVTGGNSANGTRLQIWTCTGAANQKWTHHA